MLRNEILVNYSYYVFGCYHFSVNMESSVEVVTFSGNIMTSAQSVQYIEKWIGYLNDTDREMSRLAAEKLAGVDNRNAVEALIEALNNRPDDIRIASARALGQIGHSAAVKPLIKLLKDSNPMVATSAAEALGAIRNTGAVYALSEVLRRYKTENNRHFQVYGSERGVYMAAVDALKQIDTPQARLALNRYYR